MAQVLPDMRCSSYRAQMLELAVAFQALQEGATCYSTGQYFFIPGHPHSSAYVVGRGGRLFAGVRRLDDLDRIEVIPAVTLCLWVSPAPPPPTSDSRSEPHPLYLATRRRALGGYRSPARHKRIRVVRRPPRRRQHRIGQDTEKCRRILARSLCLLRWPRILVFSPSLRLIETKAWLGRERLWSDDPNEHVQRSSWDYAANTCPTFPRP